MTWIDGGVRNVSYDDLQDGTDELQMDEAMVSTDLLRSEDVELSEKSVVDSDTTDSWTDKESISSMSDSVV